MTNKMMRDGTSVANSDGVATASSNEKAAHTPGPWRVSERHSGALIDVKARGLVVAMALVLSADPEADPGREAEANARLIAAAPELYAALKLFNLTEDSIVCGTATTLTVVLPFELISKAATAIAKAEGRS